MADTWETFRRVEGGEFRRHGRVAGGGAGGAGGAEKLEEGLEVLEVLDLLCRGRVCIYMDGGRERSRVRCGQTRKNKATHVDRLLQTRKNSREKTHPFAGSRRCMGILSRPPPSWSNLWVVCAPMSDLRCAAARGDGRADWLQGSQLSGRCECAAVIRVVLRRIARLLGSV